MIPALVDYVVLPAQISRVEREHLARINRIAVGFFLLHLPVLVLVAALNGTRPWLAAELCALTLFGPLVAFTTLDNPREISMVFGITSVFMGGLLVHFGQGPMQIEMHFYFFVSVALLSVFANPLIIIVAALTVALHHLTLFLLLPSSLFNYQAGLSAVAVHTLFVALEAIAGCFVARSFFDNVVGLEKVIERRTEDLRRKNGDLKMILDNVGQGLLIADANGVLASEHSRTLETWLGSPNSGDRVWNYLEVVNQEFGRALKGGWVNLADEILSKDAILASLPRQMSSGGREYLFEYKEMASTSSILIVISDISSQLERKQMEDDQRETVRICENVTNDRQGCVEFVAEANELVDGLRGDAAPVAEVYRAVHTLKGNASLFGITSLERACQAVESRMTRGGGSVQQRDRAMVVASWEKSATRIGRFLGGVDASRLIVAEADYLEALSSLRGEDERSMVVKFMETWRYEAATQRLERIAEQVRALAGRLGKLPIEVKVEPSRLRLPQAHWSKFWSAFAHVVRNAVDHGIESAAERLAAGKEPRGCITLSMAKMGNEIRLKVTDDGRGISWPDLRRVAAAVGLPVETPQQVMDAMFVDGVTTMSEVSEISGQGIGMGAIRAACREMGGTIQLTSEPGRGTRLVFVFPLITAVVPPALAGPRPIEIPIPAVV